MPEVPPDVLVPRPTTTVAVKERSPLTPVLAAVAALAVAGVGVALVTGRDQPADGDPVALVREYFAAFSTRDCETAVDLVDTDGRPGEPARGEAVDACEEAYDTEDGAEGADLVSAELVSRDADRATVRTEIREGGQLQPSEPQVVPLVRIDGEWKLDLGEILDEPASGDATGGDPAP